VRRNESLMHVLLNGS